MLCTPTALVGAVPCWCVHSARSRSVGRGRCRFWVWPPRPPHAPCGAFSGLLLLGVPCPHLLVLIPGGQCVLRDLFLCPSGVRPVWLDARDIAVSAPPPPSLPFCALSSQISATTKRGCRPWADFPWGPGNRGADLLLPPAPTESKPSTPNPRMPLHRHCRPSHGDRGPSGSGRRAKIWIWDPHGNPAAGPLLPQKRAGRPMHEPYPPPPPACAPDRRGARSWRPLGLKSGGCEGLRA